MVHLISKWDWLCSENPPNRPSPKWRLAVLNFTQGHLLRNIWIELFSLAGWCQKIFIGCYHWNIFCDTNNRASNTLNLVSNYFSMARTNYFSEARTNATSLFDNCIGFSLLIVFLASNILASWSSYKSMQHELSFTVHRIQTLSRSMLITIFRSWWCLPCRRNDCVRYAGQHSKSQLTETVLKISEM